MYVYTTFFLSICQWVFWVVSTFCFLQMLLWTLVHKYLFESLLWILWGIYPEKKLLLHVVVICLTFFGGGGGHTHGPLKFPGQGWNLCQASSQAAAVTCQIFNPLHQKRTPLLTFWGVTRLFSQSAPLFYIPISNAEGFLSLYSPINNYFPFFS